MKICNLPNRSTGFFEQVQDAVLYLSGAKNAEADQSSFNFLVLSTLLSVTTNSTIFHPRHITISLSSTKAFFPLFCIHRLRLLHLKPHTPRVRNNQTYVYIGLQAWSLRSLQHVCRARARGVKAQNQGQPKVSPAITLWLIQLDTNAVTVMPPELRRKR